MSVQFKLGTVEEDIDSTGLLKVKVRTNEGPEVPTSKLHDAKKASIIGGGNNYDGAGFNAPPEPGQQVLVCYESDSGSVPIIIGCINAAEGGNKNSNIEFRTKGQQASLIRILRDRYGNTLKLSARERDETKALEAGIALYSGQGNGLNVLDSKKTTLNFSSAVLTIMNEGISLISSGQAGIVINDIDDGIDITTKNKKNRIQLLGQSGAVTIRAETGFNLTTRNDSVNIKSPDGDNKLLISADGAIRISGANPPLGTRGPVPWAPGSAQDELSARQIVHGQRGAVRGQLHESKKQTGIISRVTLNTCLGRTFGSPKRRGC